MASCWQIRGAVALAFSVCLSRASLVSRVVNKPNTQLTLTSVIRTLTWWHFNDKLIAGMTPGSAALFPSPGHYWTHFARRFFFPVPRFSPFPHCGAWSQARLDLILNASVLKRTVTHAVCTWRCWTLPSLRFERERMQLVIVSQWKF